MKTFQYSTCACLMMWFESSRGKLPMLMHFVLGAECKLLFRSTDTRFSRAVMGAFMYNALQKFPPLGLINLKVNGG